MSNILLAFAAGVLTLFSPCVFALLPIIFSSTVDRKFTVYRLARVLLSLSGGIILVTLLFKSVIGVLGVDQSVLELLSGLVLSLYGLFTLRPDYWSAVSSHLPWKNLRLGGSSNSSWLSDVLLGVSLGSVFTSCSPTFAVIVAVVLPISLVSGLLHLLFYTLGLSISIWLVIVLGRKVTSKIAWLSNTQGTLYKVIGLIFILLGITISFGWHKDIQTFLVSTGFVNLTRLEQNL